MRRNSVGLRRAKYALPTMTESPQKGQAARTVTKGRRAQLFVAQFAGRRAAPIQIVKWSFVLGIGLVRAGSMLLGEAMMRSFYRAVVVIELRGVMRTRLHEHVSCGVCTTRTMSISKMMAW